MINCFPLIMSRMAKVFNCQLVSKHKNKVYLYPNNLLNFMAFIYLEALTGEGKSIQKRAKTVPNMISSRDRGEYLFRCKYWNKMLSKSLIHWQLPWPCLTGGIPSINWLGDRGSHTAITAKMGTGRYRYVNFGYLK